MNFTLFWRTVAARILAALVGVSILSVVISVVSVSLQARSALMENIEQRNLEIARQAARQITRYVADSMDELSTLGTFFGPLPYEPWIRDTMLAPDGSVLADGRRVAGSAPALGEKTLSLIRQDRTIVSDVAIGSDWTPYVVVSAPLVRLMEGTQLIGAGNLGHRLQTTGSEELRKLADSFNGMVESLQDRTRQLAESERQARPLTERVNDIVFALDDQGVVVFISPRLQEVTGFPASVAMGKPVIDAVPAGYRDQFVPIVRELLDGEDRITREVRVDFAGVDGRRLVLEGRLTGETGPDGRRQVYGVARDVSERARLMEQLTQAQKMEAVGRLAGGIAHDFNNLLTAIIGYCDYSLLDLADTATVQRNFDEIMKAGSRAAGLTQQLLAFSRRQATKPRVIEFNVLVTNLERLLHRLLGEDVVLDTRLHGQPCHVLADAGQVEQVVMNLCINARDAMPRGGRILVTTGMVTLDAETNAPSYGTLRGRFVRLCVSDNGNGMSPETRAHLFEPFFTTKDVGKGTGRGLSTVYGIVQQTQGAIFVESEPDRGTTFEVLIPATVPPAAAEPLAPSPTGLRGGTETVLLVEDELVIRSLVRNVLASHGYSVLEAESGEKALEIFRACRETVDIVVTDVVLPGAGGPDIVAGMVALRPGVRALYMSGYTGDVVDNHGGLAAGPSFLQKPFSPETLLRRVRDVLDSRPA